MNDDHRATAGPAVLDKDLTEQARPGHGVPSQDPNPAAQHAISPEDAEREGKSVLAGGGFVGGAAMWAEPVTSRRAACVRRCRAR